MWMDFGTHFGSFSGKAEYVKSAYSTVVLLLFHVPRGPKNDMNSEVKCSIPKMMQIVRNMAPLGLHFEVTFGTVGGQCCMLVFGSKMGTLG